MTRPVVRACNAKVRAICHATEELDRVRQAVLNTLPENLRDRVELRVRKVRGEFRNPIHIIEVHRLSGGLADRVLRFILSHLDNFDQSRLQQELEQRIDEHNHLFLRLDKQRAYLGKLQIAEGGDVVHFQFSFPGHVAKKDVVAYCLKLLEEHAT